MRGRLGSVGRCFICGSNIYDSLDMPKSWLKLAEGMAHKECYKRVKAEEKNNKLIASII